MRYILGLLFIALSFVSLRAYAEEGDEAAKKPGQAVSQKPSAALSAITRGLFLETHIGGGYVITDAKIANEASYPTLNGQAEGYGATSFLNLGLGYEITDAIALQAMGGMALMSGTRLDRVRDLGVFYGGAGIKFALSLKERLNLALGGGFIYAVSDNSVEAAQSGPGGLVTVGLEYYVHVRHFSVGLDSLTLITTAPQRIVTGLAPRLKYTF